MEALAVMGGINPGRQQSRVIKLKGFSVNPIISGKLLEKEETKAMLEMIDQDLKQFKSVSELDFTAGYLTGRIKEKNAAGFITDTQAEQLTKVLYSRHEILRNLAEGGAGQMKFVINGMKYDTDKMERVATVKKWYKNDSALAQIMFPRQEVGRI